MTFGDIVDGVLEHFNYDTAAPGVSRSRIQRYVNEWQRRILSRRGIDLYRRGTITLTSSTTEPHLALPDALGRVLSIRDTTNRITLTEQGLSWYRNIEADPATLSGNPVAWVPVGYTGATSLGTTTGVGIWIVSDSASDALRVNIEGTRAGGHVWSDSALLNGLTRAQVGTLTDWIEVTNAYLTTPAVGNVSVYGVAAGGTAVATIPIGVLRSRYQKIALWPSPGAALAYAVDYQRQIVDMINDSDTPDLPDDFHYLLAVGARVNEYERTNDSRYGLAKADLDRGIGALNASLHAQGIVVPVRGVPTRISRIGGWGPADTVVYR